MRNADVPKWFNRHLKSIVKELSAVAFEAYGWNVSETAKKCDLCKGTIDRLFAGVTQQPHYTTIAKICRGLAVEVRFVRKDNGFQITPKGRVQLKKAG